MTAPTSSPAATPIEDGGPAYPQHDLIGPWTVGILNANHTVSIMDGEHLYDREDDARNEANRRFKDKPFLAYVPWPVPHQRGRSHYGVDYSARKGGAA